MGLKINTNLSAQTALSSLHANDSKMNVAIERLSSGLRIVRAASDPAGLVISEKYQAQVDGLGQAISNSKDGINMVQTTEGALNEVSSILRSVRTLALHAANTGPNDAQTLAADQQQIKSAMATLDRIAGQTQFGGKKVLDGSAGSTGTVTNANVQFTHASEATKTGTYSVDITQAAVKGVVTSNNGAGAAAGRTVAKFTAANAGGAALDGSATLTLNGTLTGGSAINVGLTAGDDVNAMAAKINANAAAAAAGLTASVDGAGKLNVVSDRLSAGGNAEVQVTIAAGTSTNQAVSSGITGAETTATASATGATKLRASELMTFSNGLNTVNVSLNAGTTLAAAVSSINTALGNAGIDMTASFDSANARMVLTNNQYGSGTSVTNTFSSNVTGANGTGLAGAAGTSYNVAASGAVLSGAAGAQGFDVAGTIGGFAANGKGQFLTGTAGSDVQDLELRVTATTAGNKGTVTIANNSLEFQVGAYANQTVKLSIDSVSSDRMGTSASGTTNMVQVALSSIDVTLPNGVGAQDALKVVDAAIGEVSALRSKIGSFQKDVLETTVSNLGVAQQNITATESNIRDADFAQEMMNFSRGQILSQTGMSMLTQANQSAQQVLKLFQ